MNKNSEGKFNIRTLLKKGVGTDDQTNFDNQHTNKQTGHVVNPEINVLVRLLDFRRNGAK